MEIRKAVQSGNMEEAIELVNDLNPQVPGVVNIGEPLRASLWH
jgi:hypothetical protein